MPRVQHSSAISNKVGGHAHAPKTGPLQSRLCNRGRKLAVTYRLQGKHSPPKNVTRPPHSHRERHEPHCLLLGEDPEAEYVQRSSWWSSASDPSGQVSAHTDGTPIP